MRLFLPPVMLDRASPVPLHCQIHHQIARSLRESAIDREARLPSTRAMAKLLRVSRNSVLAAYEELAGDDLIRGERGAGMRITNAAPVRETTSLGLRLVIQDAGYPARILQLADPDGNPFYINY